MFPLISRTGIGVAASIGIAAAAFGPSSARAQAAVADEVQSCVWMANVRRTRIVDDRGILFYMRGGGIYHNQLRGQCHGLKRTGRYTYDLLQGRLCMNTQIAVLTDMGLGNWMPTAVCQIGLFQPVDVEQIEEIMEAAELSNEPRRPRRRDRNRGQIEVEPIELPRGPETADEAH